MPLHFLKKTKTKQKNIKPHILILVWIFSGRGQREAMRLIQSDRQGGRNVRKHFLTVCCQVESRFPGCAVIKRAFYDKVAGTRTLTRFNSQLKIQIGSNRLTSVCEKEDKHIEKHLKFEHQVVKLEQVLQVQLKCNRTHTCNTDRFLPLCSKLSSTILLYL